MSFRSFLPNSPQPPIERRPVLPRRRLPTSPLKIPRCASRKAKERPYGEERTMSTAYARAWQSYHWSSSSTMVRVTGLKRYSKLPVNYWKRRMSVQTKITTGHRRFYTAYWAKGVALEKLGKIDEAIDSLERAEVCDPTCEDTRRRLAALTAIAIHRAVGRERRVLSKTAWLVEGFW